MEKEISIYGVTTDVLIREWDYKCGCDSNRTSYKFVVFSYIAYSATHFWLTALNLFLNL